MIAIPEAIPKTWLDFPNIVPIIEAMKPKVVEIRKSCMQIAKMLVMAMFKSKMVPVIIIEIIKPQIIKNVFAVNANNFCIKKFDLEIPVDKTRSNVLDSSSLAVESYP